MKIEERKEIVRKIAESEKVTHIPVHLVALVEKYISVLNKISNETGRTPTVEEVALEMKLDTNKVNQLKEIYEQYFSL